MNNFFIMKKVCPFFLLAAQKPLSSTIITSVEKVAGKYVVCIHTSNKVQIDSFVKNLNGHATEIETYTDGGVYAYEPPRI